ncbi:phage tail protein [Blastochloris tepida]|uniref:Oxidoreductase n=1 Tax=Blastochloris tepida TaxID=2233851 RepID=A0A348FYG2_9HYPH|nr:phage tail protein [Blastochloris tepida]BBF92345.1 oxidoreductase [Blastochloris tepida]
MSILMGLGPYRFEVTRHAYEELEHAAEGRWEKHELFGRAPQYQWLGPGEETLTIKGAVIPRYTGEASAAQLRAMQAEVGAGRPLFLVAGTGRVFGAFGLKKVGRTDTYIGPRGDAMKAEFALELVRLGTGAILRSLWP